MEGTVVAVSSYPEYRFSKPNRSVITLIAGFGVEGDVHGGPLVKHRYLAARDPNMPNLRQVHLIHAELHEELRAIGFVVAPGELGENITTRGIDLLDVPLRSRLHLGKAAVVEVTGLRTPCLHVDEFQQGLKGAVTARQPDGSVRYKAGIMGVVRVGGHVRCDDRIWVELPDRPWTPLPAI